MLNNLFRLIWTPFMNPKKKEPILKVKGVRVRTLKDGTKRYQACASKNKRRVYKTFSSPFYAEAWKERKLRQF